MGVRVYIVFFVLFCFTPVCFCGWQAGVRTGKGKGGGTGGVRLDIFSCLQWSAPKDVAVFFVLYSSNNLIHITEPWSYASSHIAVRVPLCGVAPI